jgi:hypothetical protein
VHISRKQLATLVNLEIAGFPVYYGLPSPVPVPKGASPIQFVPATATWRATFGDWQVVLRPSEVAALLPAGGGDIARLAPPTGHGTSLRKFLIDVICCGAGRVLTDDPTDDYREVHGATVSQYVVMAI